MDRSAPRAAIRETETGKRPAGARPRTDSEEAKRKAAGMRMRTLGGTGIKVSPFCLGAMMFGAWGNPDHEESIRIIHAALDGGRRPCCPPARSTAWASSRGARWPAVG